MIALSWAEFVCCRISILFFLATLSVSCFGESFGNDLNSAWADTPRGRFECRNDKSTDYLQVLMLNGRVIFQERKSPDGIVEGDTILTGIEQRNIGCPSIVANKAGYVIVVRDTQPPQYGLQGLQ